jgi:hypothetical protein
VPPWRAESEIDRALEGYAARLAVLRKQMDVEMEGHLADEAGRSPA